MDNRKYGIFEFFYCIYAYISSYIRDYNYIVNNYDKNLTIMKKLIILIFCMFIMLPVVVMADAQKQIIKSMDIIIESPTPGMLLEDGEKLALKSVQTVYGDLLESGVVTITDLSWNGEFGEDDKGNPTFKAGFPYKAVLEVMIDINGKYQTDYQFRAGSHLLDSDHFKATVNGKNVRVLESAPYFPKMEYFVTVSGGKEGPQKKETTLFDYNVNKPKYRSTLPYISKKEADEIYPPKNFFDVLVVTEPYQYDKFLNESVTTSSGIIYPNLKNLFVSKIIIDMDNSSMRKGESPFTQALGHCYSKIFNLKEVWLSDKVDIVKYVSDLNSNMVDKLFHRARQYEEQSTKLYTTLGTLFIPEHAAEAVLDKLSLDSTEPCYSIRTYKGDVYSAQKSGVSATNPLVCQKHEFIAKIMSADRICQYPDCTKRIKWYYSCGICGKCEYNKNHTFVDKSNTKQSEYTTHAIVEDLATEQAYIGVNTAGEHLYWKSCMYCGVSLSYYHTHLTPKDQKIMGVDGDFEQYKKMMKQSLKSTESQCLLMTILPSDLMFILPRKSTAIMSVWAQDGVNRALCDNLIDEDLLGTDYTKPINRQQLTSVVLLLIKEMTGKTVSADVLALNESELPHSGDVTRQELSVYIRRALQYIENHSELAYSDYDYQLDKYSDNALIKPWAKEAMAFTTAMEIIDPKTSTTLAPDEVCSIELALVCAERATLAHRMGWNQAVAISELDGFLAPASKRNKYTGPASFGNCDRIWAYRIKRGLEKFLPTTEPFTGSRCYVDAGVFHPIRSKMGKGYRECIKGIK